MGRAERLTQQLCFSGENIFKFKKIHIRFMEALICLFWFQNEQIWEETFVLLGVDGALLFGGEEQPEQVVQQSVSQQDEVG